MPRFFTPDVDALDGEYSIKVDYGTLALIPEQQSDAFHTFQSVLLKKGCYKSEAKFCYKTTESITVKLLSKVFFKDGREGLVVFSHDTDLCIDGISKTGKYLCVVHLPLKTRNYKTETDMHLLRDTDLLTIKSVSRQPALDTQDLEGFVKAFTPYQKLGVKDLEDLIVLSELPYEQRLERCIAEAQRRLEAYMTTCAAGMPGVQSKIRAELGVRINGNRKRIAFPAVLAKPYSGATPQLPHR